MCPPRHEGLLPPTAVSYTHLYTDHLIVLMLANRRCVIIPRTSIRNFDTEFLKYLERQIHHHGITALHKESAAR